MKLEKKTIAFLEDLSALLKKHKAEINADDVWAGYSECGEDIQIEFELEDTYDELYSEVKWGYNIDYEQIDKVLSQAVAKEDTLL